MHLHVCVCVFYVPDLLIDSYKDDIYEKIGNINI